jgi:hypothetical protein
MSLTLSEAIALLEAPRSPDRRRAAKRLRDLADPSAGPALLAALDSERTDPRTWETQYQMAMALGATGTVAALPLLKEMATQSRDETMVDVGLGDAILRLDRREENDVTPLLWCASVARPDHLVDGALRAIAMLRLVPADSAIDAVLDIVEPRPRDHHLRFWVAAAAAGWSGERVRRFLEDAARSDRKDIADAARSSLAGRYQKYNPL